jgi:ABC-type transport system involved in cytochrome bd biosynthesis fused ATPase/permease subunit
MWNWPALILAPALALANLSVLYALATPVCARQTTAPLHWTSAVSLALALLFTLLAWRNRHHAADPPQSDAMEKRPHFLATVATMVGALSALIIFGLWLPQWIVSPCYT